jgi:cytochrome c553
MPEYVRYSEAFLRATDDLIGAAKLRDLEAASLGLVSLATSCVSCHRHMARSRIVTTRP